MREYMEVRSNMEKAKDAIKISIRNILKQQENGLDLRQMGFHRNLGRGIQGAFGTKPILRKGYKDPYVHDNNKEMTKGKDHRKVLDHRRRDNWTSHHLDKLVSMEN